MNEKLRSICVAVGVGALVVATIPATSNPEPLPTALPELVPRLGKVYSSDRPLVCGKNSSDRRLFLFPADRSLASTMANIRRFIAVKPGSAFWFRSGSATVFDEDLASLRARNKLAADYLARMEKERQEQLRRVKEWAEPRAGDSEGLANARRAKRRWLSILEGLPPREYRAAMRGKGQILPVGVLSKEGRSVVDRMGGSAEDSATIELTPSGSPNHPSLKLIVRKQGIAGGWPDLLNIPKWVDSDGSSYGHLHRKHRQRRRGPTDADRIPELQTRFNAGPLLGQYHEVGRALNELSRRSGLPVIGEHDPCALVPYTRQPPVGKSIDYKTLHLKPLHEALEALCKEFDLEWDFQEGWIWIRSPRTVESWAGLIDLSPLPERVQGP